MTKMKQNRVLRVIFQVGFISLIAKSFVVVKDLLIAEHFGVSTELDAFLIALLVPMFAVNVLGSSFSSSIIPAYLKIKNDSGLEKAQIMFGHLVGVALLFLISICFLLTLFSSFLLKPITTGFSAQQLALTEQLFYLLVPYLCVYGMSAIFGSLYNAHKKFSLVAITPAISPIVIILFLIFGFDALGIKSLVFGTVCGALCEVVVLLFNLKKLHFSLRLIKFKITPEVKNTFRQYLPMVAGACIMSGTILIDQGMAASMQAGSVSLLNYGNRLVSFITALGGLAIGTAVLPYFSELVAQKKLKEINKMLFQNLIFLLISSVVLTLILFIFSKPIVQLIFERGAFTATNTQDVAYIQQLFLLQVPFYWMSTLIVRLISSLKANEILMWGAVISIILNTVLNFIFMQYLGVAGIALSTSCVYLVSFVFLMGALMWKKKQLQ